jgi:hypothetical protein
MKEVIGVCESHEVVISKDCIVCKLLDERDELLGNFKHIIQYLETWDRSDRIEPPAAYIRNFADHVLKRYGKPQG